MWFVDEAIGSTLHIDLIWGSRSFKRKKLKPIIGVKGCQVVLTACESASNQSWSDALAQPRAIGWPDQGYRQLADSPAVIYVEGMRFTSSFGEALRARWLLAKLPPDTTIESELSQFGVDDICDMANLNEKRTGIPGIIFISTKMGQHAGRVKYFEKTGPDQPSFSISLGDPPKMVASSMPSSVTNKLEPLVTKWVAKNRPLLQKFWDEGVYLDEDQRTQLLDGLSPI